MTLHAPRWRYFGPGLVAAIAVLLVAAPASAEFDDNTIGCAGSAVITDDDGETVTVDASDSKVTVPTSGTARWEGSIDTVTHNHFGVVNLEIGPTSVELGSWGVSENADDEDRARGTKQLPSTLGGVPPGLYAVSGFHQGDEGRCSGAVTVEVEGNPLTHPAGAGAAVGTVITGGLLALAGRPKGGAA